MAEQNYNAFWSHRQYQILGSYPINEWKDRKAVELSTRAQRVQELQNSFFNSDIGDQLTEVEERPANTAEALL